MNLYTQILEENSRKNTLIISDWIGNDMDKFDALMQLFINGSPRIAQRSAWIISVVADAYPNFLKSYLSILLHKCTTPNIHNAIKRNIIKALQNIDLPKDLHADVINMCFTFLENVNEAIAVRCHSMTVLTNLCEIYPDLKLELRMVILNALETETVSAGFKSRARMCLQKIGH